MACIELVMHVPTQMGRASFARQGHQDTNKPQTDCIVSHTGCMTQSAPGPLELTIKLL